MRRQDAFHGRLPLRLESAAIVQDEIQNHGGGTMNRTWLAAAVGAASLAAAFGTAHAQQTVKIGMPLTLSGQFADAASQMLNLSLIHISEPTRLLSISYA